MCETPTQLPGFATITKLKVAESRSSLRGPTSGRHSGCEGAAAQPRPLSAGVLLTRFRAPRASTPHSSPHYRSIALLEAHPQNNTAGSFLVNKLLNHRKSGGHSSSWPSSSTNEKLCLNTADYLAGSFSFAPWRDASRGLCYSSSVRTPCSGPVTG